MKLIVITAAAAILALGSMGAAGADDSVTGDPGPDLSSGTDAAIAPALPADSTPPQITPPTTPDESDMLDESVYGVDQAEADAAASQVAQSRPWKLNFHGSVGSYYDDNIFIAPVHKQSDFVTILTLGGGITLGDYIAKQGNYLTADYTGIGEIFARDGYNDAYEQKASAEAQTVFAHLTVKGSFEFQDLADEDIDIGTRARRQISTGNLSVRYDLSDKSYLEATSQITIANYNLYLDSNDERGGLSYNYLPDPSVTLGLGALGGVLNVQDSGSQTYEQFLAYCQVELTGKLTVKASAGVENRQLVGSGDLTTPVFQMTADYKPFDGLQLDLTAYRQVYNSAYYNGYDYIATGVSAGVEYELSPRFSVRLDGGYENSAYRGVSTGTDLSRTDDYYFVRPSLQYTASTYCKVELYYSHRQNASTLGASSFTDNQVGVTFNVTF